MNPHRPQIRKRILIGLSAIAAFLAVAVILMPTNAATSARDSRSDTLVFPDMANQLGSAKIIRVKLSDLSYTLKRAAPGSEDWVMIESGNYPVRPDRLSALADGLAQLKWAEPRTRDPKKLTRIGLVDPVDGGNGAYVEILDQADTVLASLITGRREDRLYARLPDETKAYLMSGNLPPFYTREAWLDLKIVNMLADVVSAVRITDAAGESIYLARQPGTGPRAFRPAPPYENERLINSLVASGPALAIARLAPIDVKPAAALETRRIARHITSTHDGLEVDVSAYREPDGFYVTLRAVEAGEGARRAETINMRAEGWAFQLTEFDWNEFTPPVRSIVVR